MVIRFDRRILACICVVAVLIAAATVIVKFSVKGETANKNGKYVPVLMYHHVLKDSGRLGKYCITPEEFEKDVQHMLKRGYEAVHVADLINYVEKGTPLPEKPMMLTFDDGYETVYAYIFPILKKYNTKAVVSVVGAYTDLYSESDFKKNLVYNNLTWDECAEMSKSGLVEIQNHSYDMHDQKGNKKGGRHGCEPVAGETEEQFVAAVSDDILLNNKKIAAATGKVPTCFTYPFGYVTEKSEEMIKKLGFKASMSCREGVTFVERGNPKSLYRIKRYNRPHGVSTNFLDKIIQKAH